MLKNKHLRVGVFASMKRGLEHFIYRELCFLSEEGCAISLFPTKFGPGLYNAKAGWRLNRWTPWRVLRAQPARLLISPLRYLRVMWEALRVGALIDAMIAAYFLPALAEVDVMYATFGDRKFFIGYFAKRLLDNGKPLVVTLHAYELYENPNSRLFDRALAACDQIITVSEHNREYLHSRYHIEPSQIEIVRYSVDLEDYRSEPKFVILMVAFFVERKGHDVLLQAIRQLPHDDIELWVVVTRGWRAAR